MKKEWRKLPACIRVYGQPYVDIYFINYLAKRLAEQSDILRRVGTDEDTVKENIKNFLIEYSKEREEEE